MSATRSMASARHMAQYPVRAVTGASGGGPTVTDEYHRFIDAPAANAATVEDVLAPHRARTLQRMRELPTVLCVQHGGSLDFARHGRTGGSGVAGSDRTGAAGSGLYLHATVALNTAGLPIGVLRASFDAQGPCGDSNEPRAEKESLHWIEGLRDCARAARELPETRVVCAMDREPDLLDLLVEHRERAPQVELLIRAKVDRVPGTDTAADGRELSRHLFDEVRNGPPQGVIDIKIARRSAGIKAGKRARKLGPILADVRTTLRYRRVAPPCPGAAPGEMSLVHIREDNPPRNIKALEWFFLTTLPVNDDDDARWIVQRYMFRGNVEDLFRVLETGCKIEELRHDTFQGLERAVAVNAVVAWRVQSMARFARNVPDMSAEVLFSDGELRALAAYARSRNRAAPASLGRAVELVARLGGRFRRHKANRAQIMWRGCAQLAAMASENRDESG